MTDEQIVMEIASGNSGLFAELVNRYDERIRSYIKRRCGLGAVDDVCQEFWIKVFRLCGQFRENATVRPWLYTIAATCGIDFSRRVANRAYNNAGDNTMYWGSETNNPLDNLCRTDTIDQVRQLVQRLPHNYRQVVTLTHLKGLTQAEAADIIGIPLGTVKSRLNKAFKKMRE